MLDATGTTIFLDFYRACVVNCFPRFGSMSLYSSLLSPELAFHPHAPSIFESRSFFNLQIPLPATPFFSHLYKTPGVPPLPTFFRIPTSQCLIAAHSPLPTIHSLFNSFRTLFTLASTKISRNSSGINRLRTLCRNNGEGVPLPFCSAEFRARRPWPVSLFEFRARSPVEGFYSLRRYSARSSSNSSFAPLGKFNS
jgi:hypothetical protein